MNGENICDASTFSFFLLTTVYFKLIKSINRRDICWCAKLPAATMFWNLATYQRLGYIGGVVVCTAYFLSCKSAGVLFVFCFCFFLLKSEGDSHRQNMDTLLGTLCSYCLSSSWHNFTNGLETFLRDSGPCGHIMQLHLSTANCIGEALIWSEILWMQRLFEYNAFIVVFKNRVKMILVLRHGVLSCWKQAS